MSYSIFVVNSSHQVFTSPNLIGDETIELYTSTNHVGIYLPEPPNDVVLLGREPEDPNHYPIVQEKDRYLLWGFTGNPDSMTPIGKELFINILFFLTSQEPKTESETTNLSIGENLLLFLLIPVIIHKRKVKSEINNSNRKY